MSCPGSVSYILETADIFQILIHEYFLDKYQEVEDSEWLPGDRYVCSEYKKGMEKR